MSVSRYLVFFIAVFHFGESYDVFKKNGILGQSVVLYQLEKKAEFKTLLLKYTNNTSKTKLLVYDLKNNKYIFPNVSTKYVFNNSSLVIQKLQKEDAINYELILEHVNERDEYFCTIELKVYEQICNLRVIVTEDSQNNTCKVSMKCSMQTGENVTFSWMKDDEKLNHESGTLEISITSNNANSTYKCTAQNPVSKQSSEHKLLSACNPDTGNRHLGLMRYILIPTFIALAILIALMIMVMKKLCRQGMSTKQCISLPSSSQSRPPAPEPVSEQIHESNQTVYAKVQRPKNQSVYTNAPKSPSYSTVYDLAGPCRDNAQLRSITEETRV
ncbi:signaling lymphocytic activation molecule-like [Eleutherodactylus coqui]|uniref:signaling lymphocytic activation molecule-like n=1 Tax=Eleutherodactylus coqui TaxID=57060 RepID=UPI003461B5A1